MFKSLEDLKNAVKDLDIGEDIVSFFVEAVEGEKNRGISERRKANDEARGLRQYKKALENLGYTKDESLEDFIDTISDKLSGAADNEGKGELEKELKKLRRDFEATQKQLNDERENAQRIKQDSDRKTLNSKIREMLRDKVYGEDLVAENLISNGRVALEDDGSVVWIDGDDRKDVGDGLMSYIESRPDIVKNGQRGGAGSNPGEKRTGAYSMEKLSGMSKDDVKANLAEIKESLGIKSK